MENLEQLRTQIDSIDREMAELFRRRMAVVARINAYKEAHGLPIADPAREAAMLTQAYDASDGVLNSLYGAFHRSVVEISKQYQARLRSPENVIRLDGRDGNCEIIIERGCLHRTGELVDLNRRVLIVTDDGVPAQYAQTVASQCRMPCIITVPQGEASKSFSHLQTVLERMAAHEMTRQDCVVAVGGGAVCDLAGFAASIYERGVEHYNIPTTLLAQVDASVGGKTGVNLGGVKNAVGTFSQPRKVLIDPQVLETLPERQMASGLAEALKIGVTLDPELFDIFERKDPLPHLDEIIRRAVVQKAQIVSADERESGVRSVLNFGHTVGHALEADHPELLHGECIALGMLAMSSEPVVQRLLPIYEKLRLPTRCSVNGEPVAERILHDKKRVGSEILAVEASQIGQFVIRPLTIDELLRRLSRIAEGGMTP